MQLSHTYQQTDLQVCIYFKDIYMHGQYISLRLLSGTTTKLGNFEKKPTSLLKASEAVSRSTGSIARSLSIRGRADGGKPLNVSLMHLLYGSRGLNNVALGNFDFFQYSSEGEPHSLYI